MHAAARKISYGISLELQFLCILSGHVLSVLYSWIFYSTPPSRNSSESSVIKDSHATDDLNFCLSWLTVASHRPIESTLPCTSIAHLRVSVYCTFYNGTGNVHARRCQAYRCTQASGRNRGADSGAAWPAHWHVGVVKGKRQSCFKGAIISESWHTGNIGAHHLSVGDIASAFVASSFSQRNVARHGEPWCSFKPPSVMLQSTVRWPW